MQRILSQKGKEQTLPCIIKFRTSHSPGNEDHLQQLMLGTYHYIAQDKMWIEDGKLIINI